MALRGASIQQGFLVMVDCFHSALRGTRLCPMNFSSHFREVSKKMKELSCLVVEDSPMMRQLLVYALARVKGLAVVEADDGVDALRKLESSSFDIIISDINMPVMDGMKLITRVRADERHCKTPIVVITTAGADADRQRALALGATSFITMPIQTEDVLKTVRSLLSLD